jgi:fatty acid desaturase
MFSGITLALGGLITGFILLGDSWFQLLMAAGLGIILTQYAFLAHEASHRQIFTSGKLNDIADARSRTSSSESATSGG